MYSQCTHWAKCGIMSGTFQTNLQNVTNGNISIKCSLPLPTGHIMRKMHMNPPCTQHVITGFQVPLSSMTGPPEDQMIPKEMQHFLKCKEHQQECAILDSGQILFVFTGQSY